MPELLMLLAFSVSVTVSQAAVPASFFLFHALGVLPGLRFLHVLLANGRQVGVRSGTHRLGVER